MKPRPTLLLSAAFIALAFVASSVVTGCEDRIAHENSALAVEKLGGKGPASPSPTPAPAKAVSPTSTSCGGGGGSCG